jgi:uncharacterized HAD superfamily protein
VRIAIDIDSTLHHYWDFLADIAQRRFGVELPYEEQYTWDITRLKPRQLAVCIAETHSDAVILAGRPYPGAVEVVRRWHEAGHFIHVTSHRDTAAREATERWLRQIGLAFDELYCSSDKVARCHAIGIDVLIDDSPVTISRALEHGILAATIGHPWNRDVCEEEDVVRAADWPDLERRLAPVLAQGRRSAA